MIPLEQLVAIFYEDLASVGAFTVAASDDVPEAYRRLLLHEEHMTVAMEAYHESLVDVDVLETCITDSHYARTILLRRQSDRKVVQFGILRVAIVCLGTEVREEIEQQQRPLGRILVRHNVMRTIHLDKLWSVKPGSVLTERLQIDTPQTTYGRTASIDLDGRPAVEVLEIVAPL